MEISDWYKHHFEDKVGGRYITLKHIQPLLDSYKKSFDISVGGLSENGKDIPVLKIGSGNKTVLAWSQMHGNESTTTKALFDFIKFLDQKEYFQTEIKNFLNTHTLYIIPILNPDGAELYSRENANLIDLNRDAQNLSQKESRILRAIFEEAKPELCLNMHDQRSIYGFEDGNPSTISFLSPAANAERSINDVRKISMQLIIKMNRALQEYIPRQVGRYDDSFNEACVGDTFQKAGVPTILFEAGHYKKDYQREKTREFIFYALISLFDLAGKKSEVIKYEEYFDMPENIKNYNDYIFRKVKLDTYPDLVSIAVQYQEVLKKNKIEFEPIIYDIGNLESKIGFEEKNINGLKILTDSQENLTIGANISKIFDKIAY